MTTEDLIQKNQEGYSVLHYALHHINNIIRNRESYGRVSAFNHYISDFLFSDAIRQFKENATTPAEVLLKLRPLTPEQIAIQDSRGRTFLHLATARANKGSLKLLIEQAKASNSQDWILKLNQIRDEFSLTPLHTAVTLRNSAAARMLMMEFNLSPKYVSTRNFQGNTPLHTAAANDDAAMVEDLVTLGKLSKRRVSRMNNDGKTALQIAGPAARAVILEHFPDLAQ